MRQVSGQHPLALSYRMAKRRSRTARTSGAEFKQHLAAVSCRDRLHILRTAVGRTQGELATQLGISRRSVIRYEKAQHRTPWPRLAVLLRLRQVEADYGQRLIGHFSSLGR
jgi:DNA-binding XRE family transcriptional regulator